MSPIATSALEHCSELALTPGSLFEFTSRFIPTARQQQLLALYALTQSIGSIPFMASDDAVKWAKLKWWSKELVAEPGAPSRHPALRALWESGARQQLDNGCLLKLVNDAAVQIDVVPAADEKALFEHLAVQGETPVALELALDGVEIDASALSLMAAASGLLMLISGASAHGGKSGPGLPLDLMAKYQLEPDLLVQQPASAELQSAIVQLAGRGIEWFDKGMAGLDVGTLAGSGIHLQLRWMLETRLLQRICKQPEKSFANGFRFGPADAWLAWRLCRRLGRL